VHEIELAWGSRSEPLGGWYFLWYVPPKMEGAMGKNKGVALVITLLVALVLFIAIITISSSLSVSSRRITTDQKVALEAQYAAESGLSLAAASIPAMGQEINSVINQDDALVMPSDTDWENTISTYVQNFCGQGVSLNPPDNTKHLICVADPSAIDWNSPNEPYKFLVDYVDPEAYPIDPDTGQKYQPEKFWSERIGEHTVTNIIKQSPEKSSYTVKYGFLPKEAWAYEDGSVHLRFKASAVSVGKVEKDGANLANRKIKQEFIGLLDIALSPPSFSHYMMFTNYQRSGRSNSASRVFFYDGTLFDGPVHTNEHFNFVDSPWFGDDVTSAGCLVEDHDRENCLSSTPAFYYWNSDTNQVVMTPAPPDSVPPYADPIFTKPPDWNADYIRLPTVSDAQENAARDSGLYLEDNDDPEEIGDYNVTHIVLSIGEEGGEKYQYIQVWGERLVSITRTYGECVDDADEDDSDSSGGSGGDGGGDDGGDDDGGGDTNGVEVNISPDLPLQVLVVSAPRTSAMRWLAVAARTAIDAGNALAEGEDEVDTTCPEGQHWEWYDEPDDDPEFEVEKTSYRVNSAGVMEKLEDGTWTLYRDHFNGVVYAGEFRLYAGGNEGLPDVNKVRRVNNPRKEVDSEDDCQYTHTEWDGKHYCIEPSIASFSKLTIAGHWVRIKRDITYEERPCESAPTRNEDGTITPAVCNNLDSENILGIYTDTGSINIDKNAPPNMYIDGVLMAASNRVYYRGWDTGSRDYQNMGYLHLTGGIIQNWYGRFGRIDSNGNVITGYGRKFTYDPRMRDSGLTPPYFPTFDKGKWRGKSEFDESGGGSGFWTPVEGD